MKPMRRRGPSSIWKCGVACGAAALCWVLGTAIASGSSLTPHEDYVEQYESLEQHPGGPEIVQAKLNKAIALSSFGRNGDAEADALFKEILSEHPDSPLVPEVMYYHAELLWHGFNRKRCDEVPGIALQLIERFPESAKAPLALVQVANSWVFVPPKDTQRARALCERVVKEYPDTEAEIEARCTLLDLAVRKLDAKLVAQRVDELLVRFADSRGIAPPAVWRRVLLQRASISCRCVGDRARAAKVLEQVITAFPGTGMELEARRYLIWSNVESGTTERVKELIGEQVKRFRDSPEIVSADMWCSLLLDHAIRACIHRKVKDWSLAESLCAAVIETCPESHGWLARYELGHIAEAKGAVNEAIDAYGAIVEKWLSESAEPGPEIVAQAIAQSLFGLERLIDGKPDLRRIGIFLRKYRNTPAAVGLVSSAALRLGERDELSQAMALNEELLAMPGQAALCRYLSTIDRMFPPKLVIASWNRPRALPLLNDLLKAARYWSSARKDRLRCNMVTWHKTQSVFDEVAALQKYFAARGEAGRVVDAQLLAVHVAVEKGRKNRAIKLASELMAQDIDPATRHQAELLWLFAEYERRADKIADTIAARIEQADDPDEKALLHILLGIRAWREFELDEAATHFGAAKAVAHDQYLLQAARCRFDAIRKINAAGRTAELKRASAGTPVSVTGEE